MNFMNEYIEAPIFDTITYQGVFDVIQQMVGPDPDNVKLKINMASASVFMFKSLAFTININSRTQTLRTGSSAAADYVNKIPGANLSKDTSLFPLGCDLRHKDVFTDMVIDVYEEHRSAVTSEMIGCCDMFVMCSDAMRCLRSTDPHYNDCLYRKNLEAGRIFYGKNRNYPPEKPEVM